MLPDFLHAARARMGRDPDTPLILATGASHLLTHAHLLLYPALLVLLRREFGLSLLSLGLIANVHYFASGAGALPAGWLADRIGTVPALRVCMIGSGLSLLLLALSPAPAVLAAALTLLGAFCSLHHPAGLALLSLSTRRMDRALVLHGMIGNVGIALTPFAAAAAAERIGWRACAALFALPGLVVGSIFPALAREGKGHAGESAEAAPHGPLERARPGDGAAAETAVRWRPLLFLYLTVTLTGFVYSGAMTFLPARLAAPDASGRLELAGAVTSGALLVGMLGQYLGGLLWRRLSPPALIAVLLGASVPCLWLVGQASAWFVALGSAGFAFCHFAAQPVSNGYLARWVPERRRSLGYGVYFTLSFGVGSFAAAASGYVAELRGLPAVFPFLAFVSAAAALSIAGSVVRTPPAPAPDRTPSRTPFPA